MESGSETSREGKEWRVRPSIGNLKARARGLVGVGSVAVKCQTTGEA
jgi:hypothetical protein